MITVHMVISTSITKPAQKHVESVWFNEDLANTIVADMSDDHYTFSVKSIDVLDTANLKITKC